MGQTLLKSLCGCFSLLPQIIWIKNGSTLASEASCCSTLQHLWWRARQPMAHIRVTKMQRTRATTCSLFRYLQLRGLWSQTDTHVQSRGSSNIGKAPSPRVTNARREAPRVLHGLSPLGACLPPQAQCQALVLNNWEQQYYEQDDIVVDLMCCSDDTDAMRNWLLSPKKKLVPFLSMMRVH
jgi:hypothetical protein